MTSLQIRAFLRETACLTIIEASRRQNRSPLRELDLLITDRFGVLSHGMRRLFGKEVRAVVEEIGGRHVRAGVRTTVKPQVTAPSIYA